MDRRSRACEVVDAVDFDVQRKRHVVPHQLEIRLAQQMRHVLARAGVEVVDAQDVLPVLDEALAKMRADEAGASGD